MSGSNFYFELSKIMTYPSLIAFSSSYLIPTTL